MGLSSLRWTQGIEVRELVARGAMDNGDSAATLHAPEALGLVRHALGYGLPFERVRRFLQGYGQSLQQLSDGQVATALLDGLRRGRYFMRLAPRPPPPRLGGGGGAPAPAYEPEPVREPRAVEPEPTFEIAASPDPLPLLSVAAEPEGGFDLEAAVGVTPHRDD